MNTQQLLRHWNSKDLFGVATNYPIDMASSQRTSTIIEYR